VANRSVSRFRRATAEARALVRIGRADAAEPELSAETITLWAEVRRLPRRQAQALALQHVDGRSVREVAEILGCSENTVKTHVLRAKKSLAARLREGTE
ncbi:MAG TPA: sigma factor-like helix-turn-helix DNA-binding protein, partial [Acidimicrobiales bacterium]